MKRCPACHRTYQDEAIRFCLDDGVALMGESYDPYQTLQVPPPRGTDPASTEQLPANDLSGLPQHGRPKRRNLWRLAAALAAVSVIALIAISYFYFSADRQGTTSSQQDATTNTAPGATPTPEGRWFIVFGTYPKTELSKANERLSFVKYKGYDARLIETDDYPNLKDGTWAVVMGPFRKDYAQEVANKVRSVFSDAYVKSGW